MVKIVRNSVVNAKKLSFKGKKGLPLPTSVPKVAVVDFFNTKTLDVNGDYIEDFSHGKFCNTVIRSILPSVHLSNFRLAGQKGHCADEKMSSVVKQFNKIYEKIKNGEKVDAVNFSFQIVKSFEDLSKWMNLKLTRDNVHEHIPDIKKWLKDLANPENKQLLKKVDSENQDIKNIHKAIASIENVTEQGVPVYICAGNFGPNAFNLYTLAKNSIAVKALDGDLAANPPLLYISCDNSVAKKAERGIYYTTRVFTPEGKFKGYKILENSPFIVKKKEVLNFEGFADKFVGKNIKEVLATDEDYQNLKLYLQNAPFTNEEIQRLKNVVFDIDKYLQIKKSTGVDFNPGFAEFMKRHATYTNLSRQLFLRVDAGGKLVSDPENKGLSTLTVTLGTSFATPCLLAKNLKKSFEK